MKKKKNVYLVGFMQNKIRIAVCVLTLTQLISCTSQALKKQRVPSGIKLDKYCKLLFHNSPKDQINYLLVSGGDY